jgi:hypothetical protein
MSQNLRKIAGKLVTLSKLSNREVRKILKQGKRNLVNGLSEIAHNIRRGAVLVSEKIKNSKIVKGLADKKVNLKSKRKLLCSVLAPLVVKAIITAVLAILCQLEDGAEICTGA